MPPKRKKTSLKKTIPLPISVNQENEEESLEAELKFDKEVLWCITQFEILIKSGKINDNKKNESIKAINSLKKSTNTKIQKIQLMKSYFKDYKLKMQQEEEEVAQAKTNFANQDCDTSKGLFLKKKVDTTNSTSNTFKFNFNDEFNVETDDRIEKL